MEYTAGGTTKTIRYADGTTETLRYDMAGQLVRATGSTGTLNYEYDQGGRLVRQHDEATGETVTYAYDKVGRRILMAGMAGGVPTDAARTSLIYPQYSPMNERVGGGFQRVPTDTEL